ncbi:O-antigen ligase family protein [Leifsonia shinshuensis]|uniref:O-antigen ligase family protein n=1 Tax=Leifsonia shinshuensis TaxID=150026 RepID=A0A7G6Y9B5_9MICO|nr:O-antigen ligase family protein [Leifsonia shinshuensis]QNE35080.1 O-antigen ligase family protein [Leifsonia shinshuensis]
MSKPSRPATGSVSLSDRVDAARGASGTGASVFAVLLLFTLFAGDFWRNLISWPGYFVLAGALAVGSVVLLVRMRPVVRWRKLPKSLVLFLAYAVVSLAWSAYPGATALGLIAQFATTAAAVFLAFCLSWKSLLTALANAFRWILGLSLLFELVVAIFVRRPILPLTPAQPAPSSHIPSAFYWSRDLLFHGGQIQGIVGNSNLLAMVALLGLVVFGIQFADRSVRRGTAITWLVVAVVTFALTRSSTVFVAAVFTAVVLGFALWTRRAGPERRRPVYLAAAALAIVVVVSVVLFASRIPVLLGKSEDLTGRLTIWDSVIHLAQERPAFGWGWVSYWAPWVAPFKNLAVRSGVVYLQAHNAWLDVWLQLGIVGLVIFALLVLSTLWRSWFLAVDRPRVAVADDLPYTALALLPLLLLAALLAQSLAESRILIEGGWALFALLSLKTKQSAT